MGKYLPQRREWVGTCAEAVIFTRIKRIKRMRKEEDVTTNFCHVLCPLTTECKIFSSNFCCVAVQRLCFFPRFIRHCLISLFFDTLLFHEFPHSTFVFSSYQILLLLRFGNLPAGYRKITISTLFQSIHKSLIPFNTFFLMPNGARYWLKACC